MYANVEVQVPDVKSMRTECDLGPVLPFEQLLNETEVVDESSKQDEDCNDDSSQNCNLPGPHTLLHVTNRRKVPLRKQSTLVCTIPVLGCCSIEIFWPNIVKLSGQ